MSDKSFPGDMYICIYECIVYKVNMYMYIFCSYKQTNGEEKTKWISGYKSIWSKNDTNLKKKKKKGREGVCSDQKTEIHDHR